MKVVISNSYGGGAELTEDILKLLTEEEISEIKEKKMKGGDPYTWQLDRIHPAFIRAVEKAYPKGTFRPPLVVVDIPFETREGWYVEALDGSEWVTENHRTWYPGD